MSKAIYRKQANKIFEKWKASLSERDLKVQSVADNFDDLFFEFERLSIPADIAHEFLNLAIAAHLPSRSTLKWVYKRCKNIRIPMDEFYKNWKNKIADEATNVFYARYPIDSMVEKEKGVPNGMSRSEYAKQRRYANSFPHLDLSQIPDVDDSLTDEDDEDIFDDLNDLEL